MPNPNRLRTDYNTTKVSALPAAASTTVNGASIDLGTTDPCAGPEHFEVKISVPALNTTILPDTRTLTVTLQDSADNSTFAAIVGLSTFVITGAGGVGVATTSTRYVRLPSVTARYIRASYVTGASTTDASAVSGTLALLY